MNEESTLTTFLNSRGSSNIDLTVISNKLLRAVEHWKVNDQESCFDHSIVKFAIGQGIWGRSKQESQGVRYIVKGKDIDKFQRNLLRLQEERLNMTNTKGGSVDLDVTLNKRAKEETDIEKLIEEFQEVLKAACDKSFRKERTTKKKITNKSVPWWTDELTVMRKRTNALRRRYQRTRKHEGLREQRKTIYLAGKAMYEATIKREKIQSWKEYCNLMTFSNPWNEVHKSEAGKRRDNTQITTLRKPDGFLTEDLRETLQLMLEHFTPDDKEEDTELHKLARAQALEPADTDDDIDFTDFTVEETRNAVASMDKKKAPGEDGITGEVYKSAFEVFPRYITAMYNDCL
jgi:hypothetical protein